MENKLSFALSTSNDIKNIFDQYLNKDILNQNAETTKNEINDKFDEIIKLLNVRRNELNSEIEKWKTNKIEQIKQEEININKYQDEIKEVSKKYNDQQGEEMNIPEILKSDKFKNIKTQRHFTIS